jgi:hypothetical protein
VLLPRTHQDFVDSLFATDVPFQFANEPRSFKGSVREVTQRTARKIAEENFDVVKKP